MNTLSLCQDIPLVSVNTVDKLNWRFLTLIVTKSVNVV